MSYNRVEDLEVYILAEDFANEIWKIVMTWDFFAKDTIGKQIVSPLILLAPI